MSKKSATLTYEDENRLVRYKVEYDPEDEDEWTICDAQEVLTAEVIRMIDPIRLTQYLANIVCLIGETNPTAFDAESEIAFSDAAEKVIEYWRARDEETAKLVKQGKALIAAESSAFSCGP